jgi:hypothetical protein
MSSRSPARRAATSVVHSALAAGLAVLVSGILGLALWIATLIAGLVVAALVVLSGRG